MKSSEGMTCGKLVQHTHDTPRQARRFNESKFYEPGLLVSKYLPNN